MKVISNDNTNQNSRLSPAEMKQWIQDALHYGFNMETTDYTKYMPPSYIIQIDDKTMNFQQWLHHMVGLKKHNEILQTYF